MIGAEHDPQTTPQGSLLDQVQCEAWCGMMRFLIAQDGALAQFSAETGVAVPTNRPWSPLDIAIDRACGFDPDASIRAFAIAFIRWATIEHWGEDQITPSIRGILDSLPAIGGATDEPI